MWNIDYFAFWGFVLYGCGSFNIHGYDYAAQLSSYTLYSMQGDPISLSTEHIATLVALILESICVFCGIVVPLVLLCMRVCKARLTPEQILLLQPALEGQLEQPLIDPIAMHNAADKAARKRSYERAQYSLRLVFYMIALLRYYQTFTSMSVRNTITKEAAVYSYANDLAADWPTMRRFLLNAFAFQRPYAPQQGDDLYFWTTENIYECVGGLLRTTIPLFILVSSTNFWNRLIGVVPVLLAYPFFVLTMGSPLLLYHYIQQSQYSSSGSISYSPSTLLQQLSFAGVVMALWLVNSFAFPLFDTLRTKGNVLRATHPRISRCDVWRVVTRSWIAMSLIAAMFLFVLTLVQYNTIFDDSAIDWSRPSSISTNLDWADWGSSLSLDVIRLFGIFMLLLIVVCLVCTCVACSARMSFAETMQVLQDAEAIVVDEADAPVAVDNVVVGRNGYVEIPNANEVAVVQYQQVQPIYMSNFDRSASMSSVSSLSMVGVAPPVVYAQHNGYEQLHDDDGVNASYEGYMGEGGGDDEKKVEFDPNAGRFSISSVSSSVSTVRAPAPSAPSAPPASAPEGIVSAPSAAAAPGAPQECIICFARPRTHAFQPCGHHCVCRECAIELSSGGAGRKVCPVCRAPIEQTHRIFAV